MSGKKSSSFVVAFLCLWSGMAVAEPSEGDAAAYPDELSSDPYGDPWTDPWRDPWTTSGLFGGLPMPSDWPEAPAMPEWNQQAAPDAWDSWSPPPAEATAGWGAAPEYPQWTSSPGPDLSGDWRGSGGEMVQIRGDRVRLWAGPDRRCECLFLIHQDRLIAYSPDTDVVRMFALDYRGDRFRLRDQLGQVMTFERLR